MQSLGLSLCLLLCSHIGEWSDSERFNLELKQWAGKSILPSHCCAAPGKKESRDPWTIRIWRQMARLQIKPRCVVQCSPSSMECYWWCYGRDVLLLLMLHLFARTSFSSFDLGPMRRCLSRSLASSPLVAAQNVCGVQHHQQPLYQYQCLCL